MLQLKLAWRGIAHLMPLLLAQSDVIGAEVDSVANDVPAPSSMPCQPNVQPLSFHYFDWLVLEAYAVLMIGIGFYFERRNKNADDYLLGGRSMKSWSIGISLFATLMSTLTYLAVPGEMIQHGPMILSRILAFPLIYFVVGRLVIPFIMRLPVTSAYEILEQPLGLSVRVLGSALFLFLRLLWMALIVYANSSAVLLNFAKCSDINFAVYRERRRFVVTR